MKNIGVMLAAMIVLGPVGGALALKTKKFGILIYRKLNGVSIIVIFQWGWISFAICSIGCLLTVFCINEERLSMYVLEIFLVCATNCWGSLGDLKYYGWLPPSSIWVKCSFQVYFDQAKS